MLVVHYTDQRNFSVTKASGWKDILSTTKRCIYRKRSYLIHLHFLIMLQPIYQKMRYIEVDYQKSIVLLIKHEDDPGYQKKLMLQVFGQPKVDPAWTNCEIQKSTQWSGWKLTLKLINTSENPLWSSLFKPGAKIEMVSILKVISIWTFPLTKAFQNRR